MEKRHKWAIYQVNSEVVTNTIKNTKRPSN